MKTRWFRGIIISLVLVLFALNCAATTPTASTNDQQVEHKLATPAKWELTSCRQNNWDCQSEGKYLQSGECETARKIYVQENPDRSAGCMKKDI